MSMNNPGYVRLYESGELRRRAESLKQQLASCAICPRNCRVNRLDGERGFCHSAFLPSVSSVVAHYGEEPVLSGTRGSGTIFFGNCNMQCVFCQNYQISQDPKTQQNNEIGISDLTEKMLFLQNDLRCHNINLVSPTHFVPQILLALIEAIPSGLRLPLVYNTGSYDSLNSIRMLDGIIDIYLPDLKYSSNDISRKLSHAPDYVEHSRAAINEMYRQVGNLVLDEDDIAVKGLIVRHLILPNRLAGSIDSLQWLATALSSEVTVSIMSQYYPTAGAAVLQELTRSITTDEYRDVTDAAARLGLENGWIQEMDSKEYYLPDFDRKDDPFNDV